MARKRKKSEIHPGELNLTAMIDVAFQLLSFFVVTNTPKDVIANLDVFRPSAEAKAEEGKTPPKMIRITIFPDGFTINDKQLSLNELDALLHKLAALDTNQTVLIMCTSLSKHADLVNVLDLCAKSGMHNLSVVSTNG